MESKHYNRVDHSHILDKANKVWNSNQRLLKNVKIYYNLFYTETIHPNTFDWIEKEGVHGNKGHDVGVIAQEIEKVLHHF